MISKVKEEDSFNGLSLDLRLSRGEIEFRYHLKWMKWGRLLSLKKFFGKKLRKGILRVIENSITK